MIRPSFDIISERTAPENGEGCNLVLAISSKSFSYALLAEENTRLVALRYYPIEILHGKPYIESLTEIIEEDELVRAFGAGATVLYNFPEINLIPQHLFDTAILKPVTELIYGTANRGLILSEPVEGWSMYNIYRVPRDIHAFLQGKFNAGKYWHFCSLLLKSIQQGSPTDGSAMHIVFYQNDLTLAVFNNAQLQLVQSYDFQTPEDVAYYLLVICRQFSFSPSEVQLYISGLIDEESALFTEINKYFLNAQCESHSDIESGDLLDAYPAHYFSPLLRLAKCV